MMSLIFTRTNSTGTGQHTLAGESACATHYVTCLRRAHHTQTHTGYRLIARYALCANAQPQTCRSARMARLRYLTAHTQPIREPFSTVCAVCVFVGIGVALACTAAFRTQNVCDRRAQRIETNLNETSE